MSKADPVRHNRSVLERFRMGDIKKIIVPVIDKDKEEKKLEARESFAFGGDDSHADMIMHRKRIKRRRRRNELAKISQRINRRH